MKNNVMREIRIEKILISAGGVADKLEKEVKLLKIISGRTPIRLKATKRIPALGVRPGLETGCKVTVRKDIEPLLKRLLESVSKKLKEKQIQDNHFSFGIAEYIEIPEVEYQRDIGMLGLNVTVVFSRKGKRTEEKKIKSGKQGRNQIITKEEIINFMKKNYGVEIIQNDSK